MKLLVGLGNPGNKYARHRHNIGFMALDAIHARHHFSPWRKRFRGLAAEGTVDGAKILLLKPETFMNESGRSVAEAARFLKIKPRDVVVFHDELDLAPGKLKAKLGGGHAGHNGLRSIVAQFDREFARVRIGIGHPGHKDRVAGYVLHDFAKADDTWLEPLLDAIAADVGALAGHDDLAPFQTAIGQTLSGHQSPPPKAAPTRPRANARPQKATTKRASGTPSPAALARRAADTAAARDEAAKRDDAAPKNAAPDGTSTEAKSRDQCADTPSLAGKLAAWFNKDTSRS